MNMLSAENISLSYGDHKVLSGITFSIQKGEVVSVIGASGVGKSSLLKIISGREVSDEGQLKLEEVILNYKKQLIAGHTDIAYVSQQFTENNYFTVEEIISNYLLHLTKYDQEMMLNQFLRLLNLEELRSKKAEFLSGGEKQRVSLACALAKEPKLLLLDEPFSHLDVHLRKRVGRFLKKWVKDFEASVLFVTHEGEEALSWSDRILFLKNQKIIRNYSPETAYNSPKTYFEGAFFGELNSVRINGKQVLFRPTQFKLTGDTDSKIKLKWSSSEFRGAYYAHYFSIQNAKTVVLYGTKEVSLLKEIYV